MNLQAIQNLFGGGQTPQINDPYQAQMAYDSAMMDRERAQQLMNAQYTGGGGLGIAAVLIQALKGQALDRKAGETASQALKRKFEFDTQAANLAAAKKAEEEERKFRRDLERDQKKAEATAKAAAANRAKTAFDYLPESERAKAARIKSGLEVGAQAPQAPRQPTELETRLALAQQLGATPEQIQQLVLGGGQSATPERREDAKLQTARLKDAEERARAAEKTLANVAKLEELMKSGLYTGPIDQFLPGADKGLFNSIAADLNLSTLRQNFGGNPTEGERAANAATLPGTQQYEANNRQLLAKLRAEAEAKIAEYKQLSGGQPQAAGNYQSVMAKYGL